MYMDADDPPVILDSKFSSKVVAAFKQYFSSYYFMGNQMSEN
jgi:hypothetical protein